jgi:hypothetical protein
MKLSYSKDEKFVYFRHGDEHDLRLTEMYQTEVWRNGKTNDFIGEVLKKHWMKEQSQMVPCTGNYNTCEGCQKKVAKVTSYRTTVFDAGLGREIEIEIPYSLGEILIDKQKTFRDTCDNDAEVLTVVYRIKKLEKNSKPLWDVRVVGKPQKVAQAARAAPVAVDLDGGAEEVLPATDEAGNEVVADPPAPVAFSKKELESVAGYNKRIQNAMKTTPGLDVAASLRTSLEKAKFSEEKIGAVISAIGDDKLVDVNRLVLADA